MEQKEIELIETPQQILEEFNKTQNIILQYEDENVGDLGYQTVIKQLQLQQKSIIMHSLFSPNESFKEINTEYLNFLILPYYMGDILGRLNTDRKKNLEYSQIYLNEFIILCDHYELVDKNENKTWKSLKQDRKFQLERDAKIQQYKDMKNLENKLKNLALIKEESTQREVVLTQIKINIYKALDLLKSINQELDILDYKQQLNTDKDVKAQHDKDQLKPIPKMTAIHIPKPSNNVPYLMSDEEKKHLCDCCQGKTLGEIREIKSQLVFQSGISQPTVTLDHFADGVMEDMARDEEIKKRGEMEAKLKEDEDSDNDKDEIQQNKIKKAREWENWKDEHHKGEGNMMGRK